MRNFAIHGFYPPNGKLKFWGDDNMKLSDFIVSFLGKTSLALGTIGNISKNGHSNVHGMCGLDFDCSGGGGRCGLSFDCSGR